MTRNRLFPRRRPLDQPPLRCGELLGKVDDCNFTDVVSEKWRACSPSQFGYSLKPIPYPGAGDYFYLIVMFNDRYADHLTRVLNAAEDPLIQAARIAMGVDLDPTLEATLQWIRWPL
ncbi:hypothetical protein B0H16DRAFT_1603962 [Mycena metata]|uniref:Uncharacterized protein n=1 Tax=Mycena metata TaxID=1033252 RepID=A0AAD7MKD7_9AGAR|nr:hypothetical protein B0H16DRAFT_1603962 [Mycena metata]